MITLLINLSYASEIRFGDIDHNYYRNEIGQILTNIDIFVSYYENNKINLKSNWNIEWNVNLETKEESCIVVDYNIHMYGFLFLPTAYKYSDAIRKQQIEQEEIIVKGVIAVRTIEDLQIQKFQASTCDILTDLVDLKISTIISKIKNSTNQYFYPHPKHFGYYLTNFNFKHF